MTETEKKALALLNEVREERGYCDAQTYPADRKFPPFEALCRAIEQHEAFKLEVSAMLIDEYGEEFCRDHYRFARFIITKPDPLVEVLDTLGWSFDDTGPDMADDLRAALAARGLEIREKDRV